MTKHFPRRAEQQANNVKHFRNTMKYIKKSIASKELSDVSGVTESYMLKCIWPCPYDFLLLVSGKISFSVGCKHWNGMLERQSKPSFSFLFIFSIWHNLSLRSQWLWMKNSQHRFKPFFFRIDIKQTKQNLLISRNFLPSVSSNFSNNAIYHSASNICGNNNPCGMKIHSWKSIPTARSHICWVNMKFRLRGTTMFLQSFWSFFRYFGEVS